MGSRYGRNKRRAHRERIAKLETDVKVQSAHAAQARSAEWAAKAALQNATALALEQLAREPHRIDYAMRLISEKLAQALGEELRPHAEKIMAAGLRERRMFQPIAFSAYQDISTSKVVTLRGVIPQLNYNVVVWEGF